MNPIAFGNDRPLLNVAVSVKSLLPPTKIVPRFVRGSSPPSYPNLKDVEVVPCARILYVVPALLLHSINNCSERDELAACSRMIGVHMFWYIVKVPMD